MLKQIALLGRLFFAILFLFAFESNGQEYCTISVTSTGNEYISSFSFRQIENTSGDLAYTDYYESFVAQVFPGESYEATVTLQKKYSNDQVAVFIDWDGNKSFSANEMIPFTIDGNTASATIAVPANATLGKSRLRLMLKGGTISDACTAYRYGEVEDYGVEISAVSFPPTPDFSTSNRNPFVGQSIVLSDNSTGLSTSWKWSIQPATYEFTGSTTETSQNPEIRFTAAGDYSISLEAGNEYGLNTEVKDAFIGVREYPKPYGLSASTESNWVDLSWSCPNTDDWYAYLDFASATMLTWEGAVRATRFSDNDFFFSYPVTISKVGHGFYEHPNYAWSSNQYRVRIYDADGSTVLHESAILTAQSDKELIYSLPNPLTLTNDFYVAIVSVDGTGFPSSLMTSEAKGFGHSFKLVDGEWVRMADEQTDFELQTSVYTIGTKTETRIGRVNPEKLVLPKPSTSKASAGGYKVYRNGAMVKQLTGYAVSSYRDSLVPDGEHSYYVTAYFPETTGESSPSNAVSVTVDNSKPEIAAKIGKSVFESGMSYRYPNNILTDSPDTLEVYLHNLGSGSELLIGDIAFDNSAFSVVSPAFTSIAAGDSALLKVRIAPTTEGDIIGVLSINTNDSNENPFTLNISAVAGPVKWTWLIYLLEDFTGLDGEKDVNEWEVNGSIPGKLNYLVLWDAQNDAYDGIWYIQKDESGVVNRTLVSKMVYDGFGVDFDMSNWNTLNSALLWVADNYPAENYGLTMWDHGSGIFKNGSSVNNDITKNFCNGMKLWEMERALKNFKAKTQKKFTVIGFDVCLLGQIETAYQMAPYAEYVVASPMTEPGDGWDYVNAFSRLNGNVNLPAQDLVKDIVNTYSQSYSPGGIEYYTQSTQAATSTSLLIDKVVPALNTLAENLSGWAYYFRPQIQRARDAAWAAPGSNGVVENNPDHRDLMGFARRLVADASLPYTVRVDAANLIDALNEAIILNANSGTGTSGSNGLKIFIPKDISSQGTAQQYYTNPSQYITFSNTKWDEFLYMFDKPTIVNTPVYNVPESLAAQVQNENDVKLTWATPAISLYGNPILFEDFEDAAWPPAGWEIKASTNHNGTDFTAAPEKSWLLCNSLTFGTASKPAPQYIYSGSYSAAIGYDSPGLNWLISPEVVVEADYNLYFMMWFASDNQYATRFSVKVWVDNAWTTVREWGQIEELNFYSNEIMIDLSAYVGKAINIAFVYEYNDGYEMAIDDVRIANASIGKAITPLSIEKLSRKLPNPSLAGAAKQNVYGSMGVVSGYKVYRNGSLVSTLGATDETTWVDEALPNGTYSYQVEATYTNPDGTSEKSQEATVIISQTGINDIDELALVSIFPIPSNGVITIKVETAKEFSYEIISSAGLTICSGRGTSSVQVDGLGSGFYIVKVSFNNKVVAKRLVVN